MKPLSLWKLAFSYAGFFLGAGYVSGQELLQFFAPFGKDSIPALLISFALFFLFGLATLRLPQLCGTTHTDELIVKHQIMPLRTLITILEVVFLFGCAIIMTAGTGALLLQLFGLPHFLGCALFALLVAGISLFGLQGIVAVFSVSVPLLCVATVAFAAYTLITGGLPPLPEPVTSGGNPLLAFWLISAIAFPAYSSFGSVAILAPLSSFVRSRRDTIWGIALGVFLLLVIGCSVLLSMYGMPASLSEELPMLTLASSIHPILGYVYGFLLLCAMFGASLSSMVAVLETVCHRMPVVVRHRKVSIFIACFLMFLASLFGFGDLISVIYPAYGYIGFVCMTALVFHYLGAKRKLRTKCSK